MMFPRSDWIIMPNVTYVYSVIPLTQVGVKIGPCETRSECEALNSWVRRVWSKHLRAFPLITQI